MGFPYFRNYTSITSQSTENSIQYDIMFRLCGAAASTFILLTKTNYLPFWQSVIRWRVYMVVTCSCFEACLRKCPCSFPNWETSVVFVEGRIFPGENHIEGRVRLFLWALLSAKSREWDCFQCLCIASGAECCFLLSFLPAIFPVHHSKRVRGVKRISDLWYLSWVPFFCDWSPIGATLYSAEEWSGIQVENKDSRPE